MKKRIPKKKKRTIKIVSPPPKVKAVDVSSSPESDPSDLAAHGKQICISCLHHHGSTLEELKEIPMGGYCKHLTPEWWESKGWQRDWGDAAIMAWPELEILRREDGDSFRYLILNGKLRGPVEIFAAKDGSGSWGSY